MRRKQTVGGFKLLDKALTSVLSENRLLGVGEFFVAAVVAAGVDEFLGGGESHEGRPIIAHRLSVGNERKKSAKSRQGRKKLFRDQLFFRP